MLVVADLYVLGMCPLTYTQEVTGSNPVLPTHKSPSLGDILGTFPYFSPSINASNRAAADSWMPGMTCE